MKGLYSVLLLVMSNAFMTVAWYGHLKFKSAKGFDAMPLIYIVLISWGIAFFEYCLMVPANRIGFAGTGGPFSLLQLKVIQEVVSLSVFTAFTVLLFRTETFRTNHIIGFGFLILAVYFMFKK